jgi:hypothetical protein
MITKGFWEHGYTSTPLFAKKRLEGVDKKGLVLANAEKRGCMWLKTLWSFFAAEWQR